MTGSNGDYCELFQAQNRVAHLNRLLAEANGMIDVLQGRVELSRRECQVWELTARGHTSKETAAELRIGVKTAEGYRTSLMKKLRVHDVVRLTHCAIRLGVIEP